MAHISSPVRLIAGGLLALGITAATISPHVHAAGSTVKQAVAPSRASGQLGPLLNIPQTWNNCGPTSVAEVLAYWGISRTQYQVKAVLRADGNPYGMSPYGVPAYMRSLGLRALLGIDGSERVVKALVSNGFPVIVSQYVSLSDHVGHYRPIQAYDDTQRIFVSSDPYLGQGHVIGYDEFDAIWRSTNRRFMVLYPPGRQPLLDAVLASAGWNMTAAYRQDLAREQGLLHGTVHDLTGYGSHRNYYLSLAWDDLELGRYSAARQAIQQALHRGASPIVAGWVSTELRLAAH
ncbi:MAG TPA: C39 family peptidase [Chloroflexota bacterium]|jgi:hypothetical protein|nr:C39 family peptidase [Chloroflexota bacterium]